ncbi:MAG TPA: YceI family protein [Rhodothermales bacterium]|nr:YceI family protein [Rhodothermales bacterium]
MKWLLLIGSLLLVGCAENAPSNPPMTLPARSVNLSEGDKLHVDTERSIIRWRGTKFWGLGKHEGIVWLASGTLTVQDAAVTAGSFVIDMNTIEVTDIPKSDPIPRKRLRNHLMDDDFFAVATYPTAQFTLTKSQENETHHQITGDLTLRGQTHPVTFAATFSALSNKKVWATAQFSIDRQRWGVAYRGSRLTNDLVDDDIHLELVLVATAKP